MLFALAGGAPGVSEAWRWSPREASQGLEVHWHSSHPPPRVRSRAREAAGSKPRFSPVAARVADDAEDGPVNRRACAGAAASRCRSQERSRRPAGSRAGPLRACFSGRLPGPPGATAAVAPLFF